MPNWAKWLVGFFAIDLAIMGVVAFVAWVSL